MTNIPTTFSIRTGFRRRFITPRSTEPDNQRREYILNILLVTLCAAATIATAVSVINFLTNTVHHASFISTLIFTLFAYGLLALSRAGHSKLVTYILIVILALSATQLLFTWSFELPQTLLTFVMLSIVAGVLISARATLYTVVLSAVIILPVAQLQVHHYLHPNLSWLSQDFTLGDAISYVVVLAIIATVSWLSDREIDRSLVRARASEAALAQERDNLEIKVIERTRQLEETQLIRTLELQRFAEFGRLSANLLHEISNPLMAASLNLAQVTSKESALVQRSQKSLQQLERYVIAARKQLKQQGSIEEFSVRSELSQLLRLLTPVAKKAGVELHISYEASGKIYGDSVKFSQMVGNLMSNAIDAYNGAERPENAKLVQVEAHGTSEQLTIKVTDWGKGIARAQLPRIFEPFFSTKQEALRGMGLGLAMVKQFAEEDFGGSVTASSSRAKGTVFLLTIQRGGRQGGSS